MKTLVLALLLFTLSNGYASPGNQQTTCDAEERGGWQLNFNNQTSNTVWLTGNERNWNYVACGPSFSETEMRSALALGGAFIWQSVRQGAGATYVFATTANNQESSNVAEVRLYPKVYKRNAGMPHCKDGKGGEYPKMFSTLAYRENGVYTCFTVKDLNPNDDYYIDACPQYDYNNGVGQILAVLFETPDRKCEQHGKPPFPSQYSE
ncbi:MAG: hypothetical protein JJ957_19180 [Pseudomonadales bacterium]|nr:hypothetical protein [Pseudomonadales bacterium]MBO6597619.1 hypothetical protein [Pseudomonadales bacterium]